MFISHLSLQKEKSTESCVSSKRACDEIFQMAETIQALLFGKKSNTVGASNMNVLLCMECL
jgi:hypothetical protein